MKTPDAVNNPSHYARECSLECFDVMKMILGDEGLFYFCVGNAFKYLWRYKNKGKPDEDLAKANWYLNEASYLAINTPQSGELLNNLIYLHSGECSKLKKEKKEKYNEYSSVND